MPLLMVGCYPFIPAWWLCQFLALFVCCLPRVFLDQVLLAVLPGVGCSFLVVSRSRAVLLFGAWVANHCLVSLVCALFCFNLYFLHFIKSSNLFNFVYDFLTIPSLLWVELSRGPSILQGSAVPVPYGHLNLEWKVHVDQTDIFKHSCLKVSCHCHPLGWQFLGARRHLRYKGGTQMTKVKMVWQICSILNTIWNPFSDQ